MVGYFLWRLVASEEEQASFVQTVVQIARGDVVRMSDMAVRSYICQREFSLGDLALRFGFDDGDVFLDRSDSPYLESVRDTLQQALTHAGFDGLVGTRSTHHNPLRLATALYRNGREVRSPVDALADHTVTLWAYDVRLLGDSDYWSG